MRPARLQKALHGGVGRADARALLLLAHIRLARGQAGDVQRQAARRRERARALISQAALDQRVGDELLQILARPALHAGGNFFGEQFEEKIGHFRSALCRAQAG